MLHEPSVSWHWLSRCPNLSLITVPPSCEFILLYPNLYTGELSGRTGSTIHVRTLADWKEPDQQMSSLPLHEDFVQRSVDTRSLGPFIAMARSAAGSQRPLYCFGAAKRTVNLLTECRPLSNLS